MHPVGTGPFRFKEYSRGQFVKYVKNPDYWEKGYRFFDGVTVLIIKDPLTAKAVSLSGEADMLWEQQPDT